MHISLLSHISCIITPLAPFPRGLVFPGFTLVSICLVYLTTGQFSVLARLQQYITSHSILSMFKLSVSVFRTFRSVSRAPTLLLLSLSVEAETVNVDPTRENCSDEVSLRRTSHQSPVLPDLGHNPRRAFTICYATRGICGTCGERQSLWASNLEYLNDVQRKATSGCPRPQPQGQGFRVNLTPNPGGSCQCALCCNPSSDPLTKSQDGSSDPPIVSHTLHANL